MSNSDGFPPPPDFSPPPPPAGSEGEPPKKRKRFGCLRVFLILFGMVVVVGIVGFFLIRSGIISATRLEAQIAGEGTVTVINTTESPVRVEVIERSTADDSFLETRAVEPLGIDGFGALGTGDYAVGLRSDTGIPPPATCNLTISRGDDYQFVVVSQGIAISLDGEEAKVADDLDVETSRWCGK